MKHFVYTACIACHISEAIISTYSSSTIMLYFLRFWDNCSFYDNVFKLFSVFLLTLKYLKPNTEAKQRKTQIFALYILQKKAIFKVFLRYSCIGTLSCMGYNSYKNIQITKIRNRQLWFFCTSWLLYHISSVWKSFQI